MLMISIKSVLCFSNFFQLSSLEVFWQLQASSSIGSLELMPCIHLLSCFFSIFTILISNFFIRLLNSWKLYWNIFHLINILKLMMMIIVTWLKKKKGKGSHMTPRVIWKWGIRDSVTSGSAFRRLMPISSSFLSYLPQPSWAEGGECLVCKII